MAEYTARSRYQHRQLRSTDSIRVLHLSPGVFDDDINVELAVVSISWSPSYEALSYAWGSPTPTDPISCHGEEILVTPNCIAAMRHLRHKKRPRALWIDAICIDQSSMSERNHQVGLMGNIYSKARRVVIWLGEETVGSDYLISFLKNYYCIKKYLPPLRRFLLLRQLKKLHGFEVTSGWNTKPVGILNAICDRPWFTRKWAIQEYVLSREAYFQCGGKNLRASQLFSTIQDIYERRPGNLRPHIPYRNAAFGVYQDVFNEVRRSFRQSDSLETFSLMQVLGKGRHQIATEPKDAVFALYGLLQKMYPGILAPDYSKSVEQIYTEVARMVIKFDKALLILETTGEDSIWSNLPSWVPQFNAIPGHGLRQRTLLEAMDFSATGIGTPAIFAFPKDNKVLSVRGRIVDEIQHNAAEYVMYEGLQERLLQHSPDFPWQQFEVSIIQTFQNWLEMAKTIHGTLDRPFFRTSLFRILNHDELVDQKDGSESFEAWLHCVSSPITLQLQALLEHTPSNPGSDFNASVCKQGSAQANGVAEREAELTTIFNKLNGNRKLWNLHLKIYIQCKRTRFFITSSGLLGKGLKNIQEGDSVALIAGVNMPMILRKESHSYRSMGPAYIDGMMYGEMWSNDEKDLIDIDLI